MWQTVSGFIMTWLDPVGVVIGLVVALPVVWTWYEVVCGERRRRRRWFDEVRRESGERPAVLIVDLLEGRDIQASVERFRSGCRGLRDIPADRIVAVRRDRPLTPDDMAALHDELRRVTGRLLACGADRIHYFHAGPAVIAALVGAELANTGRVFLYHHQNGTYQNFGPLRWRM